MKIHAWILAGALALPAAALAQSNSKAPSAKPGAPPAAEQATPAPQAQPPAAGPTPEQEQQASAAVKQLVQKLRQKGDNYKLTGTISQVAPDGSAILVHREELPGVLLILPPNVGVTANGKDVAVNQLQPGDQIRATFNIAQQYPIALDIVRTGHEALPAQPAQPPSAQPAQPAPGGAK
jgi:hypothetical protein